MANLNLEPELILLNGGLKDDTGTRPGPGRPRTLATDLASQKMADVEFLDSTELCPRTNKLTSRIQYVDPTTGELKDFGGNDNLILPVKLASAYGSTLNDANFRQAFNFIADRDSFAPHQDYLNRCIETTDPCPFLNRIAERYFNITNSIINAAIGKFFIGCVARAFEPGCSFSWMPILVGGQGIGKSAFCRALVPESLFAELTATLDILNKEAYRMHVAWILELAEVEQAFMSKQAEMLKNLVSVRFDEVRLPYQLPSQLPRGFALIGTANSKEILVDGTGNRRFVPLDVGGHRIPWRQLIEERDSIWAAAYLAYQRGADWELSPKELSELSKYQEEFELRDPWHDIIAKYVEDKEMVRIEDILTNVVEIPVERQSTHHRKRVGGILRALGLDVKVLKINGKNARVWKPIKVKSNSKVSIKHDDF